LNVGDKINYKLPKWTDPEGNDPGMVYINSMENQDFPPFVSFDNSTNTINMKPNSTKYQGRTYYFSVVLKEVKSDYMMNIYYMTVKMNGDTVDDADGDNTTKIDISISYLDYHSNGILEFSVPVNMYNVINHLHTVFDIYVNNTESSREEIKDIEITDVGSKQKLNFTVKF
jgi:hypothetical protein